MNNQDILDIDHQTLIDMPTASHNHNRDRIVISDGGLLVDMHCRRRNHENDPNLLCLRSRSSSTALPPFHEPERIANRLFLVVGGTHLGMEFIEVLCMGGNTLFNPVNPRQQPPDLQSFALLEGHEVPSSPGFAATGSRILMLGGLKNRSLCRDIYMLDTEQDRPEFTLSAGRINKGKASPSICEVGGDIYLLNGFAHLTNRWTCDFERYHPGSDSWETLSPLRFLYWMQFSYSENSHGPPYEPLALLAFGDRIFVSNLGIDATCYDTTTDSWEKCEGRPRKENTLPFCTPNYGVAGCTVHLNSKSAGDGLFLGLQEDGFLYLYRMADWSITKIVKCAEILDGFDEESVNCFFAKFGQDRYVLVLHSIREGFTLIVAFTCQVVKAYSTIKLGKINSWRYDTERFAGFFRNGEKRYQVLGCIAI